MADHVVYSCYNGKMFKSKEPKGNPDQANFVITYNDRDWSGFRTLAECEKQFPEIEKKNPQNFVFQVIERI